MKIHPTSDIHSVEKVGFILSLTEEFTVEEFKKILSLDPANYIKSFFNRTSKQIVHEFIKKTGHRKPKSGLKDVQNDNIDAIKFDRICGAEDVDWTLLIKKDSFRVYCNKYTRWIHIWPVANRIMNCISSLFPDKKMNELLLGYLDCFQIEGNVDDENIEFDLELLFNPNSKYIANVFFDVDLPTASVVRFCSFNNTEVDGDIVTQVSITFSKQDALIEYYIDCSFRLQIENALPMSSCICENESRISTVMSAFHEKNKKILGDVLSVSAQKMIGLHREQP